jgi:hypothetical protein
MTSPIDRMMMGTSSIARMTKMTSTIDKMMIGTLSVASMTIMTSSIIGDCEETESDPIWCMIMTSSFCWDNDYHVTSFMFRMTMTNRTAMRRRWRISIVPARRTISGRSRRENYTVLYTHQNPGFYLNIYPSVSAVAYGTYLGHFYAKKDQTFHFKTWQLVC